MTSAAPKQLDDEESSRPVSSIPPAMPGESALSYEQWCSSRLDFDSKSRAKALRDLPPVQLPRLPKSHRPIVALLLELQEPISKTSAAEKIGCTMNNAKRWLSKLARLNVLIATARGHFWNEELVPRSLIGGKK